jgi:hypothetical protein
MQFNLKAVLACNELLIFRSANALAVEAIEPRFDFCALFLALI